MKTPNSNDDVIGKIAVIIRENNLTLRNGALDVGRYVALAADKNLKDSVSERSHDKQLAGFKSAPKGLMLQLNRRIKLALGASVTEKQYDDEFQEVVALIRSALHRQINRSFINWASADAAAQDKALKQSLYDTIQRIWKINNYN